MIQLVSLLALLGIALFILVLFSLLLNWAETSRRKKLIKDSLKQHGAKHEKHKIHNRSHKRNRF
jgi:hypothetical protein